MNKQAVAQELVMVAKLLSAEDGVTRDTSDSSVSRLKKIHTHAVTALKEVEGAIARIPKDTDDPLTEVKDNFLAAQKNLKAIVEDTYWR